MVDVWTASRNGSVITLSTGEVIDIDSYPGNGWTVNRCANITTSVQEDHIDLVLDRDSLPADDPDHTMTEAELIAEYGQHQQNADGTYSGHFVELKIQGQSNDLRLRYTVVRIFPIDNGDNFEVEWQRVRR